MTLTNQKSEQDPSFTVSQFLTFVIPEAGFSDLLATAAPISFRSQVLSISKSQAEDTPSWARSLGFGGGGEGGW